MEGVPAGNIVNYDETCMDDDPGKRIGVMGKGQKNVETKLNTTKGANSTHLYQPLDVGVYGSLKTAWRKVLMDWKMENPSKRGLPKECFPKLLAVLMNQLEGKFSLYLQSGYRKSGIYPLDKTKVLDQLPSRDSHLKPKQAISTAASIMFYSTFCSNSVEFPRPWQ
ncbi:hypothetical protein PR048_018668 [Dryococelus australis]|uniref:DDE-1 domain-containing protein n=1 Tax=Dryococelus australis TaxID=614101 RepID=A0ABQ9HCV8_9NEOP|nr:hypothetical protein PR048_018668 [Dryococelus australis]